MKIGYNDLVIVGYGGVLRVKDLPDFGVPPIFKNVKIEDQYLFPDRLEKDGVSGGIFNKHDIQDWGNKDEVTLFDKGFSFNAVSGYALWIDEKGDSHYEALESVLIKKEEYGRKYLEEGEFLIAKGGLKDNLLEARVAFARAWRGFSSPRDKIIAASGFKAIDFYLNPGKRKEKGVEGIVEELFAEDNPRLFWEYVNDRMSKF